MPSASECSNYSSPGLGSAARSGLRWRSDQEAGNCALYCGVAKLFLPLKECYQFWAEQRKAETQKKQEERAGVIKDLLNEANKQAETTVTESQPLTEGNRHRRRWGFCRHSKGRWSMVAVGKANDLAEVVGARNQWHGKPHYLQRCPQRD